MKRILTIGAFVAVLSACLLLSAMAEEPSVAGKWSGAATGIAGSRQTREEFSMELQQKGERVTGTYSSKVEIGHGPRGGREFVDLPVKGTLTGNQLALAFGKEAKITATVNGDSMSGSLARGNNHPLNLSATRSK
jgi:hypothetical protein